MRPLTDTLPKPLAKVRGKPLIVHHLERLAALGTRTVVINLAWLGEQLRAALGDGSRWGLKILYSDEGAQALEVGGGIVQALPWLGEEPFLVVSADVFTSFELGSLELPPEALAQLLLVPNPDHHAQGDFALREGRVCAEGTPRWTYGGIGLFRAQLFAGCRPGRFPLLPLLQSAMAQGRLGGQLYEGFWVNVGTMAQLAALR